MASRKKLPHHALHAIEDAAFAIDRIAEKVNEAIAHYNQGKPMNAGYSLAEIKLLAYQAKQYVLNIEVVARES